ncbi:hypothetical protein HZB97_03205 [Candidatus Gottesmanbacteria bacterium]|nr:hypothetical protein [Candidatus Gottesmanbacteria bacterium]
MELKASFAKIVGMPKEGRDSWTHVSDGLFLVLEINGPVDFPVAQKGKEIIAALSQAYKNLPQKNLASMESLAREIKIEGADLSLILGAQIGKVFYLVCRKGGKIIARREGKFGIILETEGSASGILQDKDIFVLASPRFNEVVSFEEAKAIFNNFSPAELAEGLTPLVHRAEDTSGVACLILQFAKIEEEWNIGETEDGRQKNLSSIIYHLKSILKHPPQGEEEKKKRIVFWVALILVILLGASIIFGFGKKVKTQKESRFKQTYEVTLHQYEEGKALLGLNNLRATTLFGEAKTSLSKLKKDFGKNSAEAKKIEELLGKIEQELEAASQVFKVAPEVFLDLGLIKEGGEGQRLAISGEKMVVLDNKNSSLYQVIVPSKSSQILAGGEDFRGSSQITISEGGVYVLTEKGILKEKLEIGNWKLEIGKDSDWGEIVGMESFGGNLYLLGKSTIWKYVGGEAGFSGKRNYLAEESSLANVSSMAIDGSVWLTTDKVLKFTQGREESFAIQGLEQPLGKELLLFVSDETKDLYILDKTNKRVVVLEKNGNYKSQYIWENLSGITDMVVTEGKKIFLLSGSKIYEIEIK